jgi:WD40 repeat protein
MYVTEADDAWYSIDDANKLSQVEWGYSMSFNKDGNILASSAGKYIKIWTFNNGALSYEKNSHMIKAHSLDINVLKFSKSSNLLVSGSDDNYINIW